MILAEEVRNDRKVSCRLPDKLTPSEWAERDRVLTAAVSAEPGPWRNDRTPYLRGVMDAVIEPGVEEITFVAGTQVGKSEALRNIIGYWISEDPGPCLFVMPSEQAVKEALEERIKPLILSSPSLRSHWSGDPHDITQTAVRLDTMTIYFGWAGSPQSLASRPCRYVVFDEVDKFPTFSGREADPISLGMERTTTYGHRRKVLKVSTPTTREGAIWKAKEASGDRRTYKVPCPHCGERQPIAWSQLHWEKLEISDKVRLADSIENNRLAWYECSSCRQRILDHHKPKMLMSGSWEREGERSKRVSFHLPGLYSPWRRFASEAADWIRADGDPGATMNFRNSRLAEPFEVQVSKREPSKIRDKVNEAQSRGDAGQARIVPDWAVLLIATCDVQKDHCYWQVDAWGYEQRSKRVLVGIAATLDEVYQNVFTPAIPFTLAGAGAVQVMELVVDSGYRKDEVTEFARRDPQRVRMAKGLSTYFGPIAEEKIEKASGVVVWNINTKQSKDTLDRLIGDPDPSRWQVYAEIPEEFNSQVTSEHKIIDPQTKQEVWVKKTSGAANHWWDCSAMSCAVATAKGAHMAKPLDAPFTPPARVVSSNRPSWMPERPGSWSR